MVWHREMFSVDILPAQLLKINLCESGLLQMIDTYSGEQGRLISNLSFILCCNIFLLACVAVFSLIRVMPQILPSTSKCHTFCCEHQKCKFCNGFQNGAHFSGHFYQISKYCKVEEHHVNLKLPRDHPLIMSRPTVVKDRALVTLI